ncbi:MAG: dolichyl-phosphate beta-glucosyltransferase [Dehalococcoidia bacterium]
MTLSIVIPAFNEEARIEGALARIASFTNVIGLTEVVVVDDGSADRTADIVRAFAERTVEPRIRLLQHPQNRGKGAALRTGLLAAESDAVGYIDADLSVSPGSFVDAQEQLARGADVVAGARVDGDGSHERVGQPLLRRLLGHMFVATQQRIVGLPQQDTQCPFKLLTREAARAIVAECAVDGWAFDVELLLVAQRQGWRVTEMPVEWRHIEGSRLRSDPATALRTLRELVAIRRHNGI